MVPLNRLRMEPSRTYITSNISCSCGSAGDEALSAIPVDHVVAVAAALCEHLMTCALEASADGGARKKAKPTGSKAPKAAKRRKQPAAGAAGEQDEVGTLGDKPNHCVCIL